MNKSIVFLCATMLLGGIPAHGQPLPDLNTSAPTDSRLAALKSLKVDASTVVSSERSDSPTATFADGDTRDHLPLRTVVKLVLSPAKGSHINVELWLPDLARWNGCLLGLGNGGAAGHINSANLAGPAAGGYAVVTTDMGTAPNADSGVGNPEMWKDFGFHATHLMTVSAKQFVRAYHGRGPSFSYFSGSSTGGQQALQEAQRYPEDYDGIFAGIAAHCRTPLHAYFLWNQKTELEMPLYPYPAKTVWDEISASYKPVAGLGGAVGRISDRFLPPASE